MPRRAVVPGSITAAPLTAKVTAGQIYEGQQVTLTSSCPLRREGSSPSSSAHSDW